MSRLRPECGTSTKRAIPDATALYMIRDAVARHPEGLIRGALHRGTLHCAMGAFFHDNPGAVIYESIIDEVAAYNDSVIAATPKTRRRKVLAWLRWRLRVLEGAAR